LRSSPGALIALLLLVNLAATGQQVITLLPGADIQGFVDGNPENTTFVLSAGTYRLQSIQPKNGDSFIGQNQPILSGAQVLTTFSRLGFFWFVDGQTQAGQRNGSCDPQHPLCMYPEDLYFDSVPLLHVGSLDAVGPGCWFFDYPNQRIYFADDPTGHLVETSVTRSAFSGSATNVTISGLIVEKYAVPAQFGAIGDQYPGSNWTVTSNEVRWNHSGGISLASGSTANQNYVHHNGQKGFGGSGNNILVQSNEVSFNNWAGFDCGWECGGMKFALTNNLTILGNFVHDNQGPGMWIDTDNINTLYDSNVVSNNIGGGITHEISYAAIIRYNTVCDNFVSGPTNWLWGSQIQIQNSQNVQVYGNVVETPPNTFVTGSNGIGIIQQDRGSGAYGPYLAVNNSIHDNSIVYRGGVTSTGAVADYNQQQMLQTGNNQFDYNAYHLSDPNWYHWNWGAGVTFAGLQQTGQELHGTADAAMPSLCSTLFSGFNPTQSAQSLIRSIGSKCSMRCSSPDSPGLNKKRP